MDSRDAIPALTAIRFFPALAVIIFHFDRTVDHEPLLGPGYLNPVDFFFIVSGFILTYVYYDAARGMRAPAREFYLARAIRILPPYYASLLVSLPFLVWGVFVSGVVGPHSQYFAGALVFAPLLLQAWAPWIAFAWNPPAWSLSVEAFFYALFPALCRRTRGVTPARFLAVSYLLVVIAGARFALLDESTIRTSFLVAFPLFHLPTFLFGCALGRLFLDGTQRWSGNALFCGGMAAAGAFLGLELGLPAWAANAVLAPAYGAVLLGAGALTGTLKTIMSWKPLVALGSASYVIYMLHMPVLALGYMAERRLPTPLDRPLRFALFCVALLILSVGLNMLMNVRAAALRARLTKRLRGSKPLPSTPSP